MVGLGCGFRFLLLINAPFNKLARNVCLAFTLGTARWGVRLQRGVSPLHSGRQLKLRLGCIVTPRGSHALAAAGFLLLAGCSLWAAGDDPRGREVRAAGKELVAALERHRLAHGSYPASLGELDAEPTTSSDVVYKRQNGAYLLLLTYSPSWPQPGRISCAFSTAVPEGECAGYL